MTLQNLEFYMFLVLALVMVALLLLCLVRLGVRFRVTVSFILIAFGAGLIAGPWFYTFVHVFGSVK